MRALVVLATSGALLCGCASTARGPRPGVAFGSRIGAVHYGERKSSVDAALGHGEERQLPSWGTDTFVFYPRGDIYVDYHLDRPGKGGTVGVADPHARKARAVMIITRSARYRTTSGVGVGSTLRQLRTGVKVYCDRTTYPVGGFPSVCQYRSSPPWTDFSMGPTRRVTEIAIYSP